MNKLENHNIKYLIEALINAGLITADTYMGAKQVIHYWIRTGKLKLRQRPHNGYYMVNDKEVRVILKEFNEGGNGFWHYDDKDRLV
jgi:hypothetical protein